MPLDSQVQAVIDFVVASGRPPLNMLTPAAARDVAKVMFSVFARPAEDVGAVEDRSLPGPGGAIPIRLYRAHGTSREEVLPVMVYFHGGGFVIGNLDSHDRVCRALANRAGCAIVAVDYRLAPEHPFPAAVEDAWAAVEGVRAQAGALGIDGRRLAVGGDSAGGNLAAVTALLARDAKVFLAAQLLVYPVTDLGAESASYREFADGYMLTRDTMQWFSRLYLARQQDMADWRASPLRAADLSGLAPALVLTAGFDPLRDEGKTYADRLAAAGTPVRYRCFDGLIHGFLGMTNAVDAADEAFGECAAALRQGFAA
ncbi:MAG TPA: alpha/beta hydrolase [Stellaceae bacterium]|nr:alpha/beta hydrolase [Stellaceae bacterium]